jgi:hypothetical protein
VASITGTVNGVTNPSYSYDPNGNLSGGANRTVIWTGWNMPASIASDASTLTYWWPTRTIWRPRSRPQSGRSVPESTMAGLDWRTGQYIPIEV